MPRQSERQGIASVLLHAHLPYGPRFDRQPSLEQAWLFEAVTNCYLPLLDLVERLPQGPEPWLTVSLSPTLLEMWRHPAFARRYREHLARGRALLRKDADNAGNPEPRRRLAAWLERLWAEAGERFDGVGGDLCGAWAQLARANRVELITTAATHAFLPAYQADHRICQFQIDNGIATFTEVTGLQPRGFWLPECAYFPGLETILESYGIEYFCCEDRALLAASPPAQIEQPLRCPNGLVALGRNNRLSQQVWNARIGYPGHPDYREFHRDGIEDWLPGDRAEFMLADGACVPFGMKYWRVSGHEAKDWYDPDKAAAQAERDARTFVGEVRRPGGTTGGPPQLAFLPFDAELFGHWWFEGPRWLETVLTELAACNGIQTCGAAAAIAAYERLPEGQPAASSWGRDADFSFWVNRETDWLYALLDRAHDTLSSQLRAAGGNPEKQRILRQAGRELLLAQASDWPFMIRAGTTVAYALERLQAHLARFHLLCAMTGLEDRDQRRLECLEQLDSPFPRIRVDAMEMPHRSD